MTPEEIKALREPFADELVGKLPRVTCGDCAKKRCQKHQKARCSVCQAFVSTQHIHIDYVGHAAVTDRLIQCDPDWSWEPVAFDDFGAPYIRHAPTGVELWIRLTVHGKTMLGVGTEDAGKFELPKVLIGDAIRNAAMRFGVALDLWSKQDLLVVEESAEAERVHEEETARQALFEELRQRVEQLDSPQSTMWEAAKASFARDWWKTDDGLGHADFTLAEIEDASTPANEASRKGRVPDPPPEPSPPSVDDDGDAVKDAAYYRRRIMAMTKDVWADLPTAERQKRRYALAAWASNDPGRTSLNDLTLTEQETMVQELARMTREGEEQREAAPV